MLLSYQAAFYVRTGRLAEAEQILHQCEAIYKRLEIPPVPGASTDPAFLLGIIAMTRGDYSTAMTYGARMRQTSETYPHAYNHLLAYYLMAEAAIGLGDYQAAQEYAQQAHGLAREQGNHWFIAYTSNQLGNIARTFQDFDTARRCFTASYDIRATFNDPEGMALALCYLGEIALHQGSYEQGCTNFEQSQALYRQIHDPGGLARALNGLASALLLLGDPASARERLKEALEIATMIQFVPLILTTLIHIGELLLQVGQREAALRLLRVVEAHPALADDSRDKLQQLLAQHQLSPDTHPDDDLPSVVTRLLLAFPDVPDHIESLEQRAHVPKFQQPLLEPLTEREQEVLHYIAQGMQNREIAEKLTVTLSTVKAHINHIYGKLGVSNRVQATTRARELRLLPGESAHN